MTGWQNKLKEMETQGTLNMLLEMETQAARALLPQISSWSHHMVNGKDYRK
jgi:hypothetical protein